MVLSGMTVFRTLNLKATRRIEFVGKERVVAYIEEYAEMVNATVRSGVEVLSARPFIDRAGFYVETTQGVIEARRIVSATGAFQQPIIPSIVPKEPSIQQIHSAPIPQPGTTA